SESARVHLINKLSQRVEALVTDITADPLNRLNLIQDQQEASLTCIAEYSEDALQKIQSTKVVKVSLDAGIPFGMCCHIRLPSQPGDDALRRGYITLGLGAPISPQGRAKHRRQARHPGKSLFQQVVGALQQSLCVVRRNAPLCQDIFFQREEPAIDDIAQRSLRRIRSRQPLSKAAIHGL